MHARGLYAITDANLLPGEHLREAVSAAIAGGCRWVQYRDKSDDTTARLWQAGQLLAQCRRSGARLIINDDIELARQVGADGVHLGQDDAEVAQARRQLGPRAIVGVTCHDQLALAQQAVAAGASYVAFGRFFPSTTKPDAPPAPLALLERARRALPDTPLVAIGGITLDNAASVIGAGADLVAVSHGLFAAEDIAGRSRAFARLWPAPESATTEKRDCP